MPMTSTSTRLPQTLRVGDWRVDPTLDCIERNGALVKLEPRSMRLLLALAERPGLLVSFDELLVTVWKDAIVTSSSVYECVAQLRKALGDTRDPPHYIATVPRKGYRLIAPVAADIAPQPAADDALRPSPPPPPPTSMPAAAGAVRFGLAPLAAAPIWALAAFGVVLVAAIAFRAAPPAVIDNARGIEAVSADTVVRPASRATNILWVDDKPDNNVREREAMSTFGVRFDLALSTEEALVHLNRERFDLVISDMNRPGDPRAGYALLSRLRENGDATPLVLFTSSCTDEQMLEARGRGALGCATRISELMQMVFAALEARR
jgi:DNA-binding winged helix-turn-helix (wHTH) protein/CheY-like chemotaxis protein